MPERLDHLESIARCATRNKCSLTLALSGRAPTVGARRGRTMYQGARGAPAPRHHGPLERVVRWPIDDMSILTYTVCREPKAQAVGVAAW